MSVPASETQLAMPGRAFTLTELLVSLAIIAVLVSLIAGGVARTRQIAETVACRSNLRQIGVMLNGYLMMHDSRLPTLYNRKTTADPRPAVDTVLADDGQDGASNRVFAWRSANCFPSPGATIRGSCRCWPTRRGSIPTCATG